MRVKSYKHANSSNKLKGIEFLNQNNAIIAVAKVSSGEKCTNEKTIPEGQVVLGFYGSFGYDGAGDPCL